MKLIYSRIFLEHDTGIHPENRKRLESLGALLETNIEKIENGENYLEIFHTKEHIKRVKAACQTASPIDPDTLTSKGSYKAAVYAVSATIMASRRHESKARQCVMKNHANL